MEQGRKAPGIGRRFRDDESGSVIVFGLILFLLMATMGGIAVDLMRYETTRTALQQTLDRGVLAAASLTQDLDPEGVVRDYVDKAGLGEFLDDVEVVQGLNFREVDANASALVPPFFMKLVGVEELIAPAVSAAEQRINNVEVVMVLDISGSMQNQPTRIINLRAAAQEFVDELLLDDTDNRISISVVPYNGQVNLGPSLMSKFNIYDLHGVANNYCVDLPSSVYSGTAMSRTNPMPQTGHVDSFSTSSTSNSYQAIQPMNTANIWCPTVSANYVRVHSNDATTLKAQIAALSAIGATSIHAGMKWGVTLLDPASRGIVNELVAEGVVPSHFAGRPFDFDDEEVMKVVILMTDGEHFREERMNDGYRTGLSPIWRSNGDGNLSIHHPSRGGSNVYWVPHRNSGAGEWRSAPWNSGAGTTQLTWVNVWQRARVSWVAWQLYARALGTSNDTRSSLYSTWMSNFRTQTETNLMDSRLQSVCTAAKSNGVVVFGIAFEAPANGRTQILNCSTSPSHYFDAQGLEIATAFRAIASQITYLRLTQ